VLAVRRPAEDYVETHKPRPWRQWRAHKRLTSIESDRARRKIKSPLCLVIDDIEAPC
jgi:hypothetical protein